jgi:exonuclease, DNA polymerase III, epsilon subunit family
MLLDRLSAYIFDSYNEGIERWNSILEYGLDDDFEEYLVNSTSIDEAEMNELLLEAKEIDDTVEVKTKEKIKIDQVVLTKKSERIPLNEIENIDDWDRGFDEGFPFYLEGEDERKAGNIKESIKLFDIAREKGYSAPALYRSYAMAYRKIKDYENEILILQEGIERDERHRDSLEGRLNKAIELLYKKQNSKK